MAEDRQRPERLQCLPSILDEQFKEVGGDEGPMDGTSSTPRIETRIGEHLETGLDVRVPPIMPI
jgi:hypothetical protein